jgi:Spy/CpxP family protein refolding chaperone
MFADFKFWHRAARHFHNCHHHHDRRGHGFAAHAWGGSAEEMDDDPLGGGFGVRRPLRFLAHKLDLDERQIGELARILDELKTERAQAEVDRRRTLTAFADSLTGDAFDTAKAAEGGELRAKSAERLRDAVLKALQRIHVILNAEQRIRLAYLIRTGTLSI